MTAHSDARVGEFQASDEPQGMGLDIYQENAVAWRLMARLAADWSAHIDWEDVPELGEYAWEQLAERLDEVAATITQRSTNIDRGHNIDSVDLIQQMQDGPRPQPAFGSRDGTR